MFLWILCFSVVSTESNESEVNFFVGSNKKDFSEKLCSKTSFWVTKCSDMKSLQDKKLDKLKEVIQAIMTKDKTLDSYFCSRKIELFLQPWVSLCGLLVRWGRLAVGWLILSSEFCLNVSLIDWKSLVGVWIYVMACVWVWAGLISLLGC